MAQAIMDTAQLRVALQKVNYMSRNRTLPILSNALVEFSDGKATITSTDMEKAIKVEIDSENIEMPSMVLPRKTVVKFVSGNSKTNIRVDKKKVSLDNGIGILKLECDSVQDFPPIPKDENLTWNSIEGKWFCSMLGIVATACAEELSRPVLTGIAFNDGKMAAADGFRLAAFKDSRLTFGLGDKQVIVPLETIKLIRRLFYNAETIEVAFATKNYRAYFKSGNTMLTSQLIQGTYPQWEQLIPEKYECRASFSAPLFIQRLKMIDESKVVSGIVRYMFHKKDKTNEHECLIESRLEDISDGSGYSLACPVKIEAGEESKIAINYKYVIDAIKPFSMCNIELTSPSAPAKFTGDIEGLTVVVMPMFVQW